MDRKFKQFIFPLLSFCLALIAALFWVALRVNYSGISKFLGADTNPSFLVMNLPLMVCAAAWIGVLLALIGLAGMKKWATVTGFAVALVMTVGAVVVVCFGAWDYLRFILGHFWKTLAASLGIAALALLLFFPVKGHPRLKWTFLAVVTAAAVVAGFGLRPCRFTYLPVVYAVEDTYQIVFSTSDSAVAWVQVGDETYYDLYAGSSRSADKVHKITLPQASLDQAGSYTVFAQQMIYRGPFGGYKGKVLSQAYSFRPVDSSDGLCYASLSDVHRASDAAVRAAKAGEPLDFLVLAGDLIDMVETEKDAQFANVLAHEITGGGIPVIYARGNHEIKGEYGELLYKYVGSKNQEFAYTVTLGDSVYAAVLDMGEDHEDDWWEYYGTAQFDLYREAQASMLEAELEKGTYARYPYRMAICHIPVVLIEESGLFEAPRQRFTALLNQMGTDISLSGHEHRIWYFLPDTLEPGEALSYSNAYGETAKAPGITVTDFSFPVFLSGQRSIAQNTSTQGAGLTDYMCLHTCADLDAGIQRSRYLTSYGAVAPVAYPFATSVSGLDQPAEQIQTPLQ